MEYAITPKKRISSIDALRGFALFGILLRHCIEHFDLTYTPELSSPFWQVVDNWTVYIIEFLFAGKAYAIFSLLFGLSFFMQMESQAGKGVDFRWRFVWRLFLLFVLGYLNGLIYMGEFFVVYAILGIFLIPLFKVPTKWLLIIACLLFLQIPDLISFISLMSGKSPNEPTHLVIYMGQLFDKAASIFINGSFTDMIKFNLWQGQLAKLLWVFNNARYLQLIGLFIIGMIIGRYGIHKSEEKIIKYSRKILPYSLIFFTIFYGIVLLLPLSGVEGFALRAGKILFMTYANLGMTMVFICGFMLIYYKTKATSKLDKLAPVGRMSVTNYMGQAFMGVPLFYGFGANLAVEFSFLQCLLVGFVIFAVQLSFSNWWMKHYYYGPMEWIWRTATWFKKFPLKRKTHS